jgi:hypothetical protein
MSFIILVISLNILLIIIVLNAFDFEDIAIRQDNIVWLSKNKLVNIHMSDIENVRTGFYNIVIETDELEERIWVENPKRAKNKLLTSKL